MTNNPIHKVHLIMQYEVIEDGRTIRNMGCISTNETIPGL